MATATKTVLPTPPPTTPVRAIERHALWYVIFFVTLAGVIAFNPQQLSVLNYKACILSMTPIGAYWAERFLFQALGRLDPTLLSDNVLAARIIARAVIYLGTIIAAALAL